MAYDIFISFKNTDSNGQLTEDVAIANEVYKQLTDAGMSVFFSNVILMQQGSAAYKEAIETALDEAKVLVAIATSAEYLTSEWVSYEREGFHNDILSGRKTNACIVPYLKNIFGMDVPRSLRNYQTFQIDASPVSEVVEFIKRFFIQETTDAQAPASGEISLVTGKHKSTYSADTKSEFKRLKIQAANTREADMTAINYVCDHMKDTSGLRILDMGCAYGFVTRDRFSHFKDVNVLGLDINQNLIEFARENNYFNGVHYEVCNLESEDFEDRLEEMMEKYGIEEFDIIFASLVIHHLKNPNKLLRRIRKFLSKDGFIIIRGSDDGSVITSHDDGLIKKIIDLHLNADGISDRHNGRKIYSQLITSGYKNVVMKNYIKDLSGLSLDERDEIFFERFSYRKNYLKRLVEKDPYSEKKRKDYEQITLYLNELENKFNDESFWYCEIDFVGIAQKR